MDLAGTLLQGQSKRRISAIAAQAIKDPRSFHELLQVFITGTHTQTLRASWALCEAGLREPDLVNKHTHRIIAKMQETGIHPGVWRNLFRMWEETDIPEEFSGTVYDMCLTALADVSQPVAVKANAMSAALRVVLRHHELATELRLIIEDMMPYAGAAVRARGTRVLKRLQKI
jgi:hypothetical protein